MVYVTDGGEILLMTPGFRHAGVELRVGPKPSPVGLAEVRPIARGSPPGDALTITRLSYVDDRAPCPFSTP